jgi:hypothetical protein
VTVTGDAMELHDTFRENPALVRGQWLGKRARVTVQGTWKIADIDRAVNEDGNYQFHLGCGRGDPDYKAKGQMVAFIFPREHKLQLQQKLREYASQRRVGDQVSMLISGTIAIWRTPSGVAYLVLDDAELE